MQIGERNRRVLAQGAGIILLLAVWQVVGKAGLGGKTLPSLMSVLDIFAVSWRRDLLLRAAAATGVSAAIGLCLGSVTGLAVAILARLLPGLEPGLDRLSVVVNAMPAIALGPVLIITAGRQTTPALLAAVPVFFQMYVAATSGLACSDRRARQYFCASGSSKWRQMLLLDLPSALPALLGCFKICITTAMLGAIVGEWFGAARGLGIVMINSMQNFQIPLLWSAVLVTAGISLTAYMLTALLEDIAGRRMT